ncbi:amino acid ABC transporter permease [Protaetiibacter mangrovi]|uniref:Amino acid ABC transporter permease n=1 Tax=Protaetiibacter mangrovi TaxID=2970926 RepID=A0ABT1ZFB7_9MICO|nr:amino acid ABC transporter permease [Protaetiibacter mangrovi]MCS0499345.1 amino acid ABC transporter permease [Protaetiibacter mangrovi]TPX03366.1 amino acid ABC transporter permease [Schumannella luteola]
MDAVLENLPTFLRGFGVTIALLGIAGAGALVIGTLVAAMRISPVGSLRGFAVVYTEILRNTPLTLVLFFCAFILPYLGVRIDFFVLAAIGLTAYTSPFVAEAVRSGVNGVPVGQAEAARSIGLGFGQTLGLVVMPQAIRMVIPPLINVLIALTKNTSVAGAFFVKELFASAQDVINVRGDQVFAILMAVAVFYLVITVTLGRIAAVVEKRVAVLR